MARSMTQAGSRRPVIAESEFNPGAVHVEVMVAKVSLRYIFL